MPCAEDVPARGPAPRRVRSQRRRCPPGGPRESDARMGRHRSAAERLPSDPRSAPTPVGESWKPGRKSRLSNPARTTAADARNVSRQLIGSVRRIRPKASRRNHWEGKRPILAAARPHSLCQTAVDAVAPARAWNAIR